jgi:predicted TPR repeat methyltransferase
LDYQAHILLRNAIGRCLKNNPKIGRVLDLGCGTGLCGIVFRDLALELIGIDLSPKMIAKSKTLDTYEKLEVCDIHEYLARSGHLPFDLIIAGDVLVYSGELDNLFTNIAKNLSPHGRFAFTVENLTTGNFQLQPSGRFAHSSSYIHTLAKTNALQIVLEEEIVPRKQESLPIPGRLYVLTIVKS